MKSCHLNVFTCFEYQASRYVHHLPLLHRWLFGIWRHSLARTDSTLVARNAELQTQNAASESSRCMQMLIFCFWDSAMSWICKICLKFSTTHQPPFWKSCLTSHRGVAVEALAMKIQEGKLEVWEDSGWQLISWCLLAVIFPMAIGSHRLWCSQLRFLFITIGIFNLILICNSEQTPPKTNGWNLKITPLERGKENHLPNLHVGVPC